MLLYDSFQWRSNNSLYRFDSFLSFLQEHNIGLPQNTVITGLGYGHMVFRQPKVIRSLPSLETWPSTLVWSPADTGVKAGELLLNYLETGKWN